MRQLQHTIVVQVATLEVNYQLRVDTYTQIADLKVQVRTGRVACWTTQADDFTSLDALVLDHADLRQVTIDSLKTVGVTNHDIVAVSLRVPSAYTNLSAPCSMDLITRANAYVRAVVPAAKAWTPSEMGGHFTFARTCKAGQVDLDGIRYLCHSVAIGVNAYVSPHTLVDIVCRVHFRHVRWQIALHFVEQKAVYSLHQYTVGQVILAGVYHQGIVLPVGCHKSTYYPTHVIYIVQGVRLGIVELQFGFNQSSDSNLLSSERECIFGFCCP